MSYACATAPLASSPSPAPVSRKPACCSSCGLPVRGHKGPLGSRCPAQESLRGAEGDTSLNASPGKGGERVGSCWNCEGPLTPTHQCEEVFEYDSDEGESCYYNPDSDPCGQCPPCRFRKWKITTPENLFCWQQQFNDFLQETTNYIACRLWMYSAVECRLHRVDGQYWWKWELLIHSIALSTNISSSSYLIGVLGAKTLYKKCVNLNDGKFASKLHCTRPV